ncbi:unnamed protein product, partial [Ceratitis capitata]
AFKVNNHQIVSAMLTHQLPTNNNEFNGPLKEIMTTREANKCNKCNMQHKSHLNLALKSTKSKA